MATKKNAYIVEGGLEVREGVVKLPSGAANQRPTPSGAVGELWGNNTSKNVEMSNGTEFRAIEVQNQWINISSDTAIPSKRALAYLVNTTAGPVTVTLPATPSDKQSIIFVDMKGTFQTNNLRINGNGRPIRGTTDLYLGRDKYLTLEIYYVDNTTGWNIRYGQDVLGEFELGDAAVKDVGTDVGDVMGVGAFGLGGALTTATRVDELWSSNNLNDVDRTGFYTTSGTTNGPLGDTSGVVIHVQRAFTAGTNAYQQYVAPTGLYYRTKAQNGTWSAWANLGGALIPQIGVDLNLLISNGRYITDETCVNRPPLAVDGGHLTVSSNSDGSLVLQTIYQASGNRLRVWTRRKISNSWTEWIREVTEDHAEYLPKTKPTLRLDFANGGQLDNRVTFTRNSTATYVDADGLIKTVAPNVPRFHHESLTGERLGLLIEGARTQLLSNSQAVTHNQNQTVSGTYSYAKIIVDSTPVMAVGSTSAPLAGYMGVTCGAVTLPGGRTTFSVFTRKQHGDVKGVMLQLRDVVNTDNKFANVYFDYETGEVVQADGGPSNVNTYFRKLRNGWFRTGLTFSGLAGPISGVVTVFPFTKDVNGNRVLMEVTNYRGLEVFAFDTFQVELGEGVSSPILTTTGTATRAADIATMPVSNWNVLGGTIVFIGHEIGGQDTGNSRMYRFTDNTTQNNVYLTKTQSGNKAYATGTIVGGGRSINSSSPTQLFNPKIQNVLTYGDAEGPGLGSQGLWSSFANPTNPTVVNKLCIGSDGSAQCFFGTVSALVYYPANMNRDIVENTSEV